MLRCLALLLGCVLGTLSGGVATAGSRAQEAEHGPPATLAVADFQGEDEGTSRFLAEMVMTALTQSPSFRLVECAEVRHACSALRLDSSGLQEPRQVRDLGEMVGVDHLVV